MDDSAQGDLRAVTILFMGCHECAVEQLGTAQALLTGISTLQTSVETRWAVAGHMNIAAATLAADVVNRATWAPIIARIIAWKQAIIITPAPSPEFDNLVGEIGAAAATCGGARPTNRKRKHV